MRLSSVPAVAYNAFVNPAKHDRRLGLRTACGAKNGVNLDDLNHFVHGVQGGRKPRRPPPPLVRSRSRPREIPIPTKRRKMRSAAAGKTPVDAAAPTSNLA